MATRKPSAKSPGRPRLVEDGNWKPIHCKAPPELHAEYLALGGSQWLRDALAASLRKRAKAKPPG